MNPALVTSLWITLGSAVGGVTRYWASNLVTLWLGVGFPWGTLLVNISGSFVIGLFATLSGPDGRMITTPDARQFVMVGVCGGYTTFSSFSLQTLTLMQAGDSGRAALNVIGSVALCLAAVWLGHVAAQAINAVR